MTDKLQDILASVQDSGALPYLLSGGAGALAGGYVASKTKKDPDESRLGRLGRILGTATAVGAGTAGAHKLFNLGLDQFNTALPEGDVSPEEKATTGPLARLGMGGAGAYIGHKAQSRTDKKTIQQIMRMAEGDQVADSVNYTKAQDLVDHINRTDPNKWDNASFRRYANSPINPTAENIPVDTDLDKLRRQATSHIEGGMHQLGINPDSPSNGRLRRMGRRMKRGGPLAGMATGILLPELLRGGRSAIGWVGDKVNPPSDPSEYAFDL